MPDSDLDLVPKDLKDDPDSKKIEHKWRLFEARHSYAWNYFDFHAKQRMTVLNFFMLFAALLLNAYVSVFKDAPLNDGQLKDGYSLLLSCLGAVGAIIMVFFVFLDRRNEELVHIAEDVLECLEYDVLFEGYKRVIAWPRRRKLLGGMDAAATESPLGIFLRQKEDERTNSCGKSRYAHGKWLPRLQGVMIVVFVFLAVLPWFPQLRGLVRRIIETCLTR